MSDDSFFKITEKPGSEKDSPWGFLKVVKVLVLLIVMVSLIYFVFPELGLNAPSIQTENQPNPPKPPSSSGSSTSSSDVEYFTVETSPTDPTAGNNVTFSVSLAPEFATPDWSSEFWFEIWVRQFGNWKIKQCYDSPCSFTWEKAAVGKLEYVVKRFTQNGDQSAQPSSGAYVLDVETTLPSVDTLPPKIVLSHQPQTVLVGNAITINAQSSDESSVEKVELYLDDVLVKTCEQKVKISNCFYSTSQLQVGAHSYYATALDSVGNSGQSPKAGFNMNAPYSGYA